MKVNAQKLVYELMQFIKQAKIFPQTADLTYKKGYYAGLYDAAEEVNRIINRLIDEEEKENV